MSAAVSAVSEQFAADSRREPGTERHQLLIGGRWVAPLGGDYVDVVNPSTGAAISACAETSWADVELAVSAARAATADPAWHRAGPRERSRLLWRVADLLLEDIDRYAALEARDSGRPVAITRTVDVPLAAQCFQLLSSWCAVAHGSGYPPPTFDGAPARQTPPRARGVSALVQACTHPLLSAASLIAPLLAAGGAAIFVVDARAPLSALALAELVHQAGIPDGVLNVVSSSEPPLAERLIGDPRIARVEYDGDDDSARRYARSAADGMTPASVRGAGCHVELLFADADTGNAAAAALDALLLTVDQGPDMSGELLVEDHIYDDVLGRVRMLCEGLVTDSAERPQSQLGPLLSRAQVERYEHWLAQLKTGRGDWSTPRDALPAGGFFAPPVVLGDRYRDGPPTPLPNRCLRVSSFRRADVAEVLFSNPRKPRTLGLWTQDALLARELGDASGCDNVRLNYTPGRDALALAAFYTRYRYTDQALLARAAAQLEVTSVLGGGALN